MFSSIENRLPFAAEFVLIIMFGGEMNIFSSHIYEVSFLLIWTVAVLAVTFAHRSSGRRISKLAVTSAALGVLNPFLLQQALARYRLVHIFTGPMFHYAILAGILAAICAVIALVRIRRSHGVMFGRGYAIAGLVFGLLWSLGWLTVLLIFACHMGQIHG